MTKCKILGCTKENIEGELFIGGSYNKKYWGYCPQHAEARKQEDEKLAKLEALEKEEEDDNNN